MDKSRNQPSNSLETGQNNNNKQEVSSKSDRDSRFESDENRSSVPDMDDTNPQTENPDNSIANTRPTGMDA